ncbi:hypothetical protein ASE55_18155 [Chryseobacterium sp. Leaf201]|nr:hypothetical protein ASE55_18155 [Chryseobacterium sp. Leaf201]
MIIVIKGTSREIMLKAETFKFSIVFYRMRYNYAAIIPKVILKEKKPVLLCLPVPMRFIFKKTYSAPSEISFAHVFHIAADVLMNSFFTQKPLLKKNLKSSLSL